MHLVKTLLALSNDDTAYVVKHIKALDFAEMGSLHTRKQFLAILQDQLMCHGDMDVRVAALEAVARSMRSTALAKNDLVALLLVLVKYLWMADGNSNSSESNLALRRAALRTVKAVIETPKLPLPLHQIDVSLCALPFAYQFNAGGSGKRDKPGTGGWSVAKRAIDKVPLSELLFAVGCHVCVNDVFLELRCFAYEILSALVPCIPSGLLLQCFKKDVLSEPIGLIKMWPMPLLTCGALAHGIEDQFAKVRLAAIQCALNIASVAVHAQVMAAVFSLLLDAVLDELDELRITALRCLQILLKTAKAKEYRRLPLAEGVDILLALLDDGNELVRAGASACLQSVILAEEGNCFIDAILRILKCYEAAAIKLSLSGREEAMFLCSLYQIGHQNRIEILGYPALLSQLLQTSDPAYFSSNVHPVPNERFFHFRVALIMGIYGIDGAGAHVGLWMGRVLAKCPELLSSPQEKTLAPASAAKTDQYGRYRALISQPLSKNIAAVDRWFKNRACVYSSKGSYLLVTGPVRVDVHPAPADLPYPCIELPSQINIRLQGAMKHHGRPVDFLHLAVLFTTSNQRSILHKQPFSRVSPVPFLEDVLEMEASLLLGKLSAQLLQDEELFTDIEVKVHVKEAEGTPLLIDPIKFVLH